ncbi:ExeM/NucH family extracellular endonuclease [Photobacterium sp. DA100]|uniref:ExeM/NucH family extracellular endonuclease n=1 Tax=Photobacterium sp. DA100 TaxID=3027472 RepID=UPI00247A5047|nr:ExeM/NucH family extracellular endonuclease [Photobacterium sp. DA100]WEM43599.1 ExeM/NucH family extracellular endonuclease [Photobacterium sp. DA100]
MKNKITLVSAAIAAALAAPAIAGIDDIIISEYVEGSSYNKAIELTNTGETDYTFDDSVGLYYDSGKYINMIYSADKASILKGLTIPAKKAVVLAHGKASAELIAAVTNNGASHLLSPTSGYNAMGFNGDDAVVLAKTTDPRNNILDIIGIAEEDNLWGADRTLRRYQGSESQSPTYEQADWSQFGKDDFSGLGDPTLEEKPAEAIDTTIGEIQGSGFRSPLLEDGEYQSADRYRVTGVVSAVANSLVKGFYLYADDGDSQTSNGLFIATTNEQPQIGATVTVTGKVQENYGMTQLAADGWEVGSEAISVPAAVDLTTIAIDDDDFEKTLERHEGMLVRLPEDIDLYTPNVKDDMRVSRTFSYDYDSRRNNMVLAYKRPNMQPNQENIAGSQGSKNQAAENDNFRLYVDSDKKPGNGEIPYYPNFKSDPENNYIRINDSVVGLEGVIHFSYGDYRLIPMKEVDNTNFIHNTDRQEQPEISEETTSDAFAIRLATQNVLNYFNSPYGGAENQHGDNRGAESQIDFERQQAKIVEAIYGLDADIIGLMEIENNGFGAYSAITELVNAVNEKYYYENYQDRNEAKSVHNKYVFVGFDSNGDVVLDEYDSVGGDAITSGLLYRPSKVALESSRIIEMPRQEAPIIAYENGQPVTDENEEIRENGKNFQRNTVAATFRLLNTGKKLTVAVNHLKSKGSTCWEDWQGWQSWDKFNPEKDDVRNDDFQGSCENFRVAAAVELGEQLAKMGGDQVVMGDFNSYANEDPMLVLTTIPKYLPEGKTIRAARDTFIGYKPQFGENGAEITKSYGLINAVEMINDKIEKETHQKHAVWSYSYNDEIGSLDHVLITSSLSKRVIDATDWHINAAESPLFDYSSKYKSSSWGNNPFYSQDPYRSSDHDSAIITLSYGYGETAGEPVLLATKSGRMEVAYPIPTSEAKAGDVARIQFSPAPADMSKVTLPEVTLTEDGKHTVSFDVNGIDTGRYTMTMSLVRPMSSKATATPITNATVTMDVEVVKRDSLEPKVTEPSYDGSGGSTGWFGLLSLMGLGLLRRKRK